MKQRIKKAVNKKELSLVEEDAAVYKTSPKKKRTDKEKKILDHLSESIDFVNKYSKGKTKTKSINQLLNEL